MPYTRTKQDRTKAAALAVTAQLLIGGALLSGLAFRAAHRAEPPMARFDVLPPAAPQPEPPPSSEARETAPEAPAPAAAEAIPTPVIAPRPVLELPVRNPVPASTTPVADSGPDATSGTAASGTGTGAGGPEGGNGGGGSGGSGGGVGQSAGARLVSGNLDRRDYRLIRNFGRSRGHAVLALTIGADGHVRDCSAIEGSGDSDLDRTLCARMGRTGWAPALNAHGDPVASALRYVATWDRD